MPSGYAHLKFGRESLPRLQKDARYLAQHFGQLFEVGLQGPDLFFYYNPVFRTEIGALGHRFHMQSGKEFFGNAIVRLRQHPSDGARAYLYGVLGHYCLDSVCHPYVRDTAALGKIGHTEMETEFDRFLMERDGIAKPHMHSLHAHYRLTRGECATAALFYATATSAAVRACSRNMIWISRMTANQHRKLVKTVLGFGGKVGLEMLMGEGPNPNCVQTNGMLIQLYRQAQERYPRLMDQMTRSISTGEPLGADFEPCFG